MPLILIITQDHFCKVKVIDVPFHFVIFCLTANGYLQQPFIITVQHLLTKKSLKMTSRIVTITRTYAIALKIKQLIVVMTY